VHEEKQSLFGPDTRYHNTKDLAETLEEERIDLEVEINLELDLERDRTYCDSFLFPSLSIIPFSL